jgi:hypothetical protein
MLPQLIPVDDEEVQAFRLPAPDPIERMLRHGAELWRLYGSTYRIQAAVFGSSTRQYVYLHKGDFARLIISPIYRAAPEPLPYQGDEPAVVTSPRAAAPPTQARRAALERSHPLLWKFEELIAAHRKRAVFIQIANASAALTEAEMADFNATFAPFGEVIRLQIPAALTFDSQHLTIVGSRRVAEALAQHAQRAGDEPR